MKKILIVINSNLFLRNYISTDAFKLLEEKYDVHYILEKSTIKMAEHHEINKFSYYKLNPLKMRYIFRVNALARYHYLGKSKTFKFRHQKLKHYRIKDIKNHLKSFFVKPRIKEIVFNTCMLIIEEILLSLFKKKYVYNFFLPILKIFDFQIKSIKSQIDKINPDLLILPSCAYDSELGTLYKSSKRKNSKLLLLIDNWDNLSSKSILIYKPCYMGVWGEQTKKHAIEIHNMDKKNVFCISNPRFQSYFSSRNSNLKSNFNWKYILFLGTSMPLNEKLVLNKLNNLIEKNSSLDSYKIIYRPHPWSRKDSFDLSKLQNVIIDPQVVEQFQSNSYSSRFQPNIDYYPSLLQNSSIIIGGLTSMIIESSIMYKNYVVLAYRDEDHFESPETIYNSHLHFEGIETLPNIKLCRHLDNLENLVLNNLNSVDKIQKDLIDKKLNYFVRNDDETYKERLLRICQKVI